MKKIIQLKLKIIAKMILAKYKPQVVGITGSVGKTSAKEAVYMVLKRKFKVRRNLKNYNNEIGLPLTVIGAKSPAKSTFGWLKVLFKGLGLILFLDRNYPEILVLEMAIDRPGDMKYLTDIVKCDIGVITLIGPNHLEFFSNLEEIQTEKEKIIQRLKPNGWAILNFDDEKTKATALRTAGRKITYGFKEGADMRACNLRFRFEKSTDIKNLLGISFDLNHKGAVQPILLPKVIGYNSIYGALAGAAVGIAGGMPLTEIARGLRAYTSPPGRMNLIAGIKGTLIVDDTYNSSPPSSISALDLVKKIKIKPTARKFAVLGEMMELGPYTEQGHREVGEYAFKAGMQKLIAVGERARDIARGAEAAGMSRDYIFYFPAAAEAGKFLQNRIRPGDLLLIKGSQAVRMEKIVKEIMAEPMRAKELLVRQGEGWM